jgi:hypothetical protein
MASTMRKAAECHAGRALTGVVTFIHYMRNLVMEFDAIRFRLQWETVDGFVGC